MNSLRVLTDNSLRIPNCIARTTMSSPQDYKQKIQELEAEIASWKSHANNLQEELKVWHRKAEATQNRGDELLAGQEHAKEVARQRRLDRESQAGTTPVETSRHPERGAELSRAAAAQDRAPHPTASSSNNQSSASLAISGGLQGPSSSQTPARESRGSGRSKPPRGEGDKGKKEERKR